MPFDYKKEYREFYLPPKKPHLIMIPRMNFVAVHGKGDPNVPDGAYQEGLRFAIREGGRTVGSGVVGKIIE